MLVTDYGNVIDGTIVFFDMVKGDHFLQAENVIT